MKKTIITLLLVAFVGLQEAFAIDIFGDLRYMVRLGYGLGGTAPVGMPATIRSLDKFTPTNNTLLGLDAYKPLTEKWGLQAGFHYQNKGMKTDAKVKGYSMEMRRGDETLSGLFTGNVVTEVSEWMVTLPLQAAYNVSPKLRLKFGPYFSYVLSNNFSGYAYDGYLRVGDPTGDKVELGHVEGERGDYDFTEDLRHWQFGLDLGADWFFSNRFGAYAGLSWGLTNIFRKDFHVIEQSLYPIYGSIGLTYKLK